MGVLMCNYKYELSDKEPIHDRSRVLNHHLKLFNYSMHMHIQLSHQTRHWTNSQADL